MERRDRAAGVIEIDRDAARNGQWRALSR